MAPYTSTGGFAASNPADGVRPSCCAYTGRHMRRTVLDAIVSILAIGLGVLAFYRGQVLLGACFTAIGILRILLKLPRLITPKHKAGVRLNLDSGDDHDQPPRKV